MRVSPFGLLTKTVAAGMTAPVSSRTRPLIVPGLAVSSAAEQGRLSAKQTAAHTKSLPIESSFSARAFDSDIALLGYVDTHAPGTAKRAQSPGAGSE